VLPTRTLALWCPDWPVAAAGVPGDVAAAVFKANRVVACSAAARAEGVARGLRRREAQARCPDVVVVEHDPARDARAFEPIVATVEGFAPRVEILRPGVCLVPTRGPSRYFGGDEALAVKVSDAVAAQTGHGCRTGIADGPFAAMLAARAGRIVPEGESAAFLAPLPVRALERPDLVDLLTRLGIRTLGDFAALPAEDVLARFGTDGALAHRLAQGLDERPPATRTPPSDFVVQRELDPPAQRVDAAAFVGKALADELHERLARMGLACTRVSVEAETGHGETLARLWRHEGALTPAAIAERVRWQLDGWLTGKAMAAAERAATGRAATGHPAAGHPARHRRGGGLPEHDPFDDEGDTAPDPTAGLTLLRLVPDEVIPDDGRQLGFWGGVSEADERAARALARVQAMLGPDAVVTAVLSGGRGPLEQVTLVPWGDPRQPASPPPADLVPAPPASPPPADLVPAPPAPPLQTPAPPLQTPPSTSSPPLPKTRSRSTSGRRRHDSPPAWPGRLPTPSPATVYPEPLPAQVHDADGRPVQVTGRNAVAAPPACISVDGGRWVEITGWAGPWPVDERWWDPPAHRRRARFQVVTSAGSAYALAVEKGAWWVEAVYD